MKSKELLACIDSVERTREEQLKSIKLPKVTNDSRVFTSTERKPNPYSKLFVQIGLDPES